GSANTMAQIPCCLIGDVDSALNLKRRHALLRFGHEVDRQKPFRQRKMSIVKDRATRYRKLIATCVAVVLIALDYIRDAFRLAARTSHAFRPAQSRKL